MKADIVDRLRALAEETADEGASAIENLRHSLMWALNRLEDDERERAARGDLTLQIKRVRQFLPPQLRRGRK